MDDNLGQVVLVADINPGSGSSYPQNIIEFNDQLYFDANDGSGEGFARARNVWATDGTTNGTDLAVDIESFGGFTEFNGKLYFSADDEETGLELWATDGTNGGTSLVADINTGENNYGFPNGSNPLSFTEFDGKLYFSAFDEENGEELWVSDGTSDGTNLVADISTSENYDGSSFPRDLTEFNGKLYFSATDGESGTELWVSDGTSDGTELLKDININDSFGYSYSPSEFTEFNGKLYFSAFDEDNGNELWVTDGTSGGTQLLKDINTDPSERTIAPGGYFQGTSNPQGFTEFNGKLYFGANDGESGSELWVTDGTSGGTQLLKDINTSDGYYSDSNPSEFIEFNGKLYFNANDGESGDELWVTDGTSSGTVMVADINPGSAGSYLYGFSVFNNELFFTADTDETGAELYKLTLDGSVDPSRPSRSRRSRRPCRSSRS